MATAGHSRSRPAPARRHQALEQARPHRQRVPPPGGAPERRRSGRSDPREDQRISRATVYRTLQWMVEAGIARKVDFGEGRFRFEHSYRHPRHFHLICKTCNRSFEFLSSDIEALVEEVAEARGFTARQSVVQIYGTCEACRTGRAPAEEGATTELLFARDALRIAIATERSGLEFYSRAARITKDARGRGVFQKLAEERRSTSHARGALPRAAQQDPQLESRPTFLFFKGAANGLFAAGADQLRRDGVDDREALHDRHPLRARLAPLLQALRRALRGLRGQADLPRVRRRGARSTSSCSSASTARDALIPRLAAAGPAGARGLPRRPRRGHRAALPGARRRARPRRDGRIRLSTATTAITPGLGDVTLPLPKTSSGCARWSHDPAAVSRSGHHQGVRRAAAAAHAALAVAEASASRITGLDRAAAEVLVNLVTGARCRTRARSGDGQHRRHRRRRRVARLARSLRHRERRAVLLEG
jgi:Fe2+ or Zn2+ uptake regulation protein